MGIKSFGLSKDEICSRKFLFPTRRDTHNLFQNSKINFLNQVLGPPTPSWSTVASSPLYFLVWLMPCLPPLSLSLSLSLSSRTKGKEKNSERKKKKRDRGVRGERIFMNIIMDWVSTVTPYVYGVTVDSYPNYLNIRHLLWEVF